MKLSCNVTLALYAFDLLELDGEDLRRAAFETRKATLASLLRSCLPGLRLNEHLTYPGDAVFRHACKMGLEGIVSKRLGSRYTSGRTRDWFFCLSGCGGNTLGGAARMSDPWTNVPISLTLEDGRKREGNAERLRCLEIDE